MTSLFRFKPAMLAVFTVAALGCSATFAQTASMAKSEYQAAKTRISEQHKADEAACDSLSGSAEDICEEQAVGKQKVARAELEARYSGKPADQMKVHEARVETEYDVAMVRCDDKAGNDKDVCQQQAKAAKTKANADVKSSQKVGEARKDAAMDKRDASYKVEAEKCDALAGDAKSSCIAAAKARFGQN